MIERPMQSLPLFADLPANADSDPAGGAGGGHHTTSVGNRARSESGGQFRSRRHLAAAARLAKAIGRLPEGSAQQTRAGQAICRHLIALLDEGAGSC